MTYPLNFARAVLALQALLYFGLLPTRADEKPEARTVEQIADTAQKSIVIITVPGRDGRGMALGTGFVVSADGLIATNLHVIGEGRPIAVQFMDGKRHDVTQVHASDRALDLALIRIDAKNLTHLELGDSDQLKQGQGVVALGNPRGLVNSVVTGVVSAQREVDGRKMIQMAIPLEVGNSGGPILDLHGKVQGVATMKSALTANLGFAMPVNSLKPLLQKPNPVPMSRWVTFGTLDPEDWTATFAGRWRQRAGKIIAEGQGSGFGGRTLCLSQRKTPEVPFEIAVTVRLDDESGAAGLAFHADGNDRHYGFYPSAGKLRLTRFDGPDVYSWKVLREMPTPHYRPGEWNALRVRIEKDRMLCFVNEQLVIESSDAGLASGKVGLAKFRDTRAEFKGFQVEKTIAAATPRAETAARLAQAVERAAGSAPWEAELVNGLASQGPAGAAALREQARRFEQQAARLRELAQELHQKRVVADLAAVLKAMEEEIDLIHAALLIAKLDNEDLDIDVYRKEVERMAKQAAKGFPSDADEEAKLQALRKYLFAERGFHGSRADYYHRANSYLSDVLDDREGLPITLSVVYLELARRIGLKVEGVGLPGHFVVRHVPAKGEPQLIDVFEGAEPLSREQADKKVLEMTGKPLREEHLAPVSKRAILVRMLHNLLGVARREGDLEGGLRYLETIIGIAPESPEERMMRSVLRYQSGRREAAKEDLDWLLEHRPAGFDLKRVEQLRRQLDP